MPDRENPLFLTSGGVPDFVRDEASAMMPSMGQGNYKPDYVEDEKVAGLPKDHPLRDWPPRQDQIERKKQNAVAAEVEGQRKAIERLAAIRTVTEKLSTEEKAMLKRLKEI